MHRPGKVQRGNALVIAGSAIVSFPAAVTADADCDEEHYIASGYFARELSLHRDFISFQPSPYTWMLAAVLSVVDRRYPGTARIVRCIFSVAIARLPFSFTRTHGAGRLAAFVLLLPWWRRLSWALPIAARNDFFCCADRSMT
ncbi:MAG TPA: hypothetical protein VFB54_19000 [Burkholderiales bacterium]|nr:hypothetical protein [Burkholderiales bacterium]